jgi:hypothetical protein
VGLLVQPVVHKIQRAIGYDPGTCNWVSFYDLHELHRIPIAEGTADEIAAAADWGEKSIEVLSPRLRGLIPEGRLVGWHLWLGPFDFETISFPSRRDATEIWLRTIVEVHGEPGVLKTRYVFVEERA